MNSLSLEAVDAYALNSSNQNLQDFSLEILSSKPFYAFEVPKFVIDTTLKVFSMGDKMLTSLCKGCEAISNAENLVNLFQDMIAMPSQLSNMKEKIVNYLQGSEGLVSVANQARKLAGFAGSSLGDYYFSCETLEAMNIPVNKIHKVSETLGLFGSSIGAASRIVDYMVGDFEDDVRAQRYPVSEKIRTPILDSKRAWDCARDISILALSFLGIYFKDITKVPVAVAIGISGITLGSRLVSVYKGFQIKKIDDANPYKTDALEKNKIKF
jgi:hypothetical protein